MTRRLLILASLGSALYYMMRQKGKNDQRMVRSLAMRAGFSIALFVLILVAHKLGYIQPTGIR